MPPLIPILIAAGLSATAASVVAFVVQVAVFALVAKALAPKQKRPGAGPEASQDRSVVVRSTTEAHRIVYGRVITSGMLAYFETTGASKEYAHMVVILAAHEIKSINRVWLDDTEIGAVDGSGNVTSGRYSGVARVIKAVGSASQAADATLVSESGGVYTSTDRWRGRAYLYLRIKRDDTAFPNGLPNVRCEIDGRLCYDPRDAATRWTVNPILIQRDILTSAWGLSADSTEIDDSLASASANVCDERVTVSAYTSSAIAADATAETLTFAAIEIRFGAGDGVTIASTGTLPGNLSAATTYYVIRRGDNVVQLATTFADALAGTARNITSAGTGTITLGHVDQVRYTCNGTFTRSTGPKEMLDAAGMTHAGPPPIFREGLWRLHAGAWSAPAVTLSESDLRDDVTEQVRPARQSLFNAIRGTYSPGYNSTQVDFFPVTNATYETQDGVQIYKDLDFPMVDNTVRAQRLAKLALELSRRGSMLTLPCKLTAFRVATWDTITLNLAVLGISGVTYRVKGWRLTAEHGVLGVDLTVQAEDSTAYGWSSSDATAPTVPPDLVLPNPSVIAPPTSLVMSSGTADLLKTGDGTIISRVKVSFTGAAEPNLWRYELQWKKTIEADYNTVYMPSDSTVYYLAPVEDGINYNIQVRTHAVLGPRSAWLTGVHTVIGKTAAPTAPSSLGVTTATGGFDITWSACPDADYFATQVYESSTNVRSSATQIAEISSTRLARSGLAGGLTRFYWVRHVDTTGNVSAFYPVSSTGGVSGVTGGTGDELHITHDFTAYLAGGASGYMTGAGYWLGYNGGFYRMHLGNPDGSYMAWTGQHLSIGGSGLGLDIKGAALRSGAIGMLAGSGFFAGYTQNLLQRTEDFAHAFWTKSNVTVTAAGVSPTGTTASQLTLSGASAGNQVYPSFTPTSTGNRYAQSVWMRAGNVSTAKLYVYDFTAGAYVPGHGAILEGPGSVALDALGAVDVSALSTTVWTRVGLVTDAAVPSGNSFTVFFAHQGSNGYGTSTIGDYFYAWGAQLNDGTGASAYQQATTASVAGAWRMMIGNSTGNNAQWDGTNLTVTGGVLASTIVAGDVQVNTTGNVRGGQSAYNTGAGFFLGYSGGAYKFSIGNPAGNYMTWDGSSLLASGQIIDTRSYQAGSLAIAASSKQVFPGTTGYVKYIQITVARSGTLTVDFTIGGGIFGGTTYGKIYRNGSAVGTERSVAGTGTAGFSEDIASISAGDTIELWGKYAGTGGGWIQDYTLKNAFRIGEFVSLQ